jgi:hypothetical protein
LPATQTPRTDAPTILGRSAGDSPDNADARAATVKVGEVSIPYTSGAVGVARVELFRSVDDEDRGGVVLRLTVDDHGSSFVPTVSVLPNGVELHLTGDAEADALLRAIVGAIAADKR